MLDNVSIAPPPCEKTRGFPEAPIAIVCSLDDAAVFTQEEEERKREAYLLQNPILRMRAVSAAITFAERNMPPHRRRNQPRLPHQKFE